MGQVKHRSAQPEAEIASEVGHHCQRTCAVLTLGHLEEQGVSKNLMVYKNAC